MEYTNSQIKEAIMEEIHSARDRRILFRRYVDGVTFDRIAEEFGLSVRHVKTIVYKGGKVISAHFAG